MKTYSETLDYLFSCYPAFQKEGQSAYKPGLDNTIALDNYLGNPHRKYKTIHVGGTNGKGSVSHLLAATLQESGLRVGLYTSPHLKDFSERIRVNGEPISQTYVCGFVDRHHEKFNEIKPSFFEATMTMAFQYFADQKVDIAVVEVGLGGRLDSTNIISPVLSVITNISLDHVALLGDTVEKIATEKAGIIKKSTPVVIGEAMVNIRQIFAQKASELTAPIFFAEDEVTVLPHADYLVSRMYDCSNFPNLEIELGGIYQQKNIATVLCAIAQLRKQNFSISDETVRRAFRNGFSLTGLKGRWQVLQKNPTVVCDTGHNEGGIRYVVEQLKAMPHRVLRIVFGMVNDKDIRTVLGLLPQDATYYFCNANIKRALSATELKKMAETKGLKGEPYGSVADALTAAKNDATADDLIYVGGSTFVVAEVI